jgi:putative AlgH/UPF0301 family transcriptional regulator
MFPLMSQSLRGHFLIAGKRLRDSNFFKTVVLMVEHGDEGAMGLVVNRPSSVIVFMMGLVSEQITQLRYDRVEKTE